MAENRPLYRLSLKPDLPRLNALGQRARVIPPGGDLGYSLHRALTALFGQASPKPFRLYDSSNNRKPILLAYTHHDEDALRDYAALQQSQVPHFSEADAALPLAGLEVKPMPPRWSAGRAYRFETRIRPVIRTTRNDPLRPEKGRERDAYFAAYDRAGKGSIPDRDAVYAQWVEDALERSGGARLHDRLTIRAWRSTRINTGDDHVNGPDVTCEGMLTVTDADAFAALLARGLGRHRAFGFGMLLLAPAG